MDLSSKKLPIILIIGLIGILTLQVMNNDSNNNKLIDPETCELYVKDLQISAKQYLGEYDQKCLDFKNFNP